MPRHLFPPSHCGGVNYRKSRFNRVAPPTVVVLCGLIFCSLTALGQDIQYTQNTVDQIKRSGLTVDPSTLGLNLEIPLGDYAGRGGASLPVALQYSSKVWHMEYQGTSPSAIGGWVSPTFATWGGWTSTLDRPEYRVEPALLCLKRQS
jgi:hypothetical protein